MQPDIADDGASRTDRQRTRDAPGAGRLGGAAAAGRGPALADALALLGGFVRHPRQVATIAPSSATLEQRLVRAAGLAHAATVVELGPGTGGTTRALLRALRPDARLLAIELTPAFHARLARTLHDPRLLLELGSAEQLAETLARRQLGAPDAVVSGIPFSTLPAAAADRIAAAIAEALAPGGRFVAYQFRADVAAYLRPHLGPPSTTWELRNLPPVRVFRWVKGEGAPADAPSR